MTMTRKAYKPVRLLPETHETLRQMAFEHRVSLGEAVRLAVAFYLQQHAAPKK